ncbi:MAG: hypothetical protein FJY36_04155 [Betaproteobacteria bacterium]|nr:hypothetical protein [Betaproteobacteria bacterium]
MNPLAPTLARWRARAWPRPRARSLLPWAYGCAGAAIAGVLAALVWGDAWQEGLRLREAVAQMQAEQPRLGAALGAADPAPGPPEPGVADVFSAGPALVERDAAWFWLQQRVQAHGLRLEWLRPEPWQAGAVLASQRAQLRLQGAWADWVQLSRQMVVHAPWWSWEQWQVQPTGVAGQVQVDARWRLWLQAAHTRAWSPPDWPAWPTGSARDDVPLFAMAEEPGAMPTAQAEASTAAAPAAWRLWGVWAQADQVHVVLGRGAEWTVLAPGQTLGPEAYRLERLGAEGVRLQGRGTGQLLLLPWERAP